MAAQLDLSSACAIVRSFDDLRCFRLGPAMLAPHRFPIDLWPPPPSPQGSLTGWFPHRAALAPPAPPDMAWSGIVNPNESLPPLSAGFDSDWRVQTAVRMERHTARSMRMSMLSNRLGKLELPHSAHDLGALDSKLDTPSTVRVFGSEDGEFLGPLLARLPSLSELDTNMDTSALHTVSQRSPPPSPSFASHEGSFSTVDLTDDGIATPTFVTPSAAFTTLPSDPFDALEALEALAALSDSDPLFLSRPASELSDDLEPMEALLWSPTTYDVHPFRHSTAQKPSPGGVDHSQLYAASAWREVDPEEPPPVPPKHFGDAPFALAHRRSIDTVKMVQNAGVAATHRRSDSAPTWGTAQTHEHKTKSKSKRGWRMGQAKVPVDRAVSWGQPAPKPAETEGLQVKHFHHHHYHHHHIHYHEASGGR